MIQIKKFLKNYYLYLILLISGTATLGSLFASEVLLMEACSLCWYQRIFMYPIAILSLVALIKKEMSAHKLYIFSLALPGLIIAGYHYFYQLMYQTNEFLPLVTCSSSVPCGEIEFAIFGFITLPLLSFFAFALIILILGLEKFLKKS